MCYTLQLHDMGVERSSSFYAPFTRISVINIILFYFKVLFGKPKCGTLYVSREVSGDWLWCS